MVAYTPAHVILLHVRVHVEESYKSMHVECFRDDIERYCDLLATSLGGHFVEFCRVLLTVHNLTFFTLFYFQFLLDVQFFP